MITLKNDDMQFLNCTIRLPTGPGLHICSSGCGSGKTTMIAEIIRNHWDEGILVVVPTIAAADDLEEKINAMPTDFQWLSCKRLVLTCNRLSKMELYKTKPQDLAGYDVLIITSVRLIIDPYSLFIDYNGGTRGFILIDEMINFYPNGFEVPKSANDMFTFIDNHAEHKGKKGLKIDGTSYYKHIYQDRNQMLAAYESSKQRFFSVNNALNKYKSETIIEHVLKNGLTPMRNKIKDFSEQTTILLFDGTADCLFDSSDSRLLPITGKRYGSNIHFEVFEKNLKRKNNENWQKDLIAKYEQPFIQTVRNAVSHGKVLIVTWKTIDTFPKNKGEADTFETGEVMGKSYNFPSLLTECLSDAGIDKDQFSVIYRGSGQDRGSNEYREYASVIFFGEWRIPDNVVGDINSMFGCKCSFRDYMKSLVIQTICRTRIREHSGDDIWVYFSKDIDYNLMYETQQYFIDNSQSKCIIDGIQKPCPKRSKTDKKRLLEMVSLYASDNKIRDAVEDGNSYSFDIDLDTLWNYIKRDRKAKGRYNNLVKFLSDKYSITMNIE